MFKKLVCTVREHQSCLIPQANVNGSTDISSARVCVISPFQVITANTNLPNPNHRFWWRTTGHALAVLLDNAGYPLESQYRNLLFYIHYVIPELGPGPSPQGRSSHWNSWMTDDCTPVELSWSWGAKNEPVVVRFSIEPIGSYAGTSIDPLNSFATHRLVQRFLSILPDANLEWFHFFSERLLQRNAPSEKLLRSFEERSNTFVAFDLEENGLILKAYFIPSLRAATSSQTRLAVVAEAIQSLPRMQFSSISNSFSLLFGFIEAAEQRLQLEVEILGIDCLAPAKSRLKIYFRSQSTSFNSVREIMTLGGNLSGPESDCALNELEQLWQLLLWEHGVYSPEKELGQNSHRTAGILYYFEIRPGQLQPTAKIYIPVRHYAQNDKDVAEKLLAFMSHRRSGFEIARYMQALKTAL